jgi:hypothetical protein
MESIFSASKLSDVPIQKLMPLLKILILGMQRGGLHEQMMPCSSDEFDRVLQSNCGCNRLFTNEAKHCRGEGKNVVL